MKREEEIKLAWIKKAAQSNHKYDEKSFKEAVEWADKHPKRYNQDELCDIQLEMMKQRDKRLIAKACEYLKSLVYQEFAGGPLERTFSDEDIEDFRKAIEE